MLVQLSEDHGVNLAAVTDWHVSAGDVKMFLGGEETMITLDCDEGLEFLQYVTYSSPALEVDTRNRLFAEKGDR